MFSPTEAVLSMFLDVYKQVDSQDANTGAIKKEWIYQRTVACHAKGIITNSATARSSDKQVFDNRYKNDQVVQIRTENKLTLREKITNIRNSENIVIWTELDYPTETPTVFEVVGVTPITDPFGSIIGYNSTLTRSENQRIGI